MTKISAVIVAHNEEKKIGDCLASLNFVDEIVVVLDKCTDKTKEIVQKFTDKIIEGSWEIEGARRNVAVSAANCEWILELDADERISVELKDEILASLALANQQQVSGFIIAMNNYVGKRLVKYGWLRTMCSDQRLMLTKKGYKKFDEDKMLHPTYKFEGKSLKLNNKIIHLVDDNISDLIARFNRYTSWRARDLAAQKKPMPNFLKLTLSSMARFDKSFFFKRGYKEGWLGFFIALLCGFYPLISHIKAKEMLDENR